MIVFIKVIKRDTAVEHNAQ